MTSTTRLGSNKEWDPDAIASSVQPYILKYNIDTVCVLHIVNVVDF